MSDSGGDTVRRNSMLVKTVRVKFDNRLQRSFYNLGSFINLLTLFLYHLLIMFMIFSPDQFFRLPKIKCHLLCQAGKILRYDCRLGYFFVAEYLGYILMCFVAMKRTWSKRKEKKRVYSDQLSFVLLYIFLKFLLLYSDFRQRRTFGSRSK